MEIDHTCTQNFHLIVPAKLTVRYVVTFEQTLATFKKIRMTTLWFPRKHANSIFRVSADSIQAKSFVLEDFSLYV